MMFMRRGGIVKVTGLDVLGNIPVILKVLALGIDDQVN